MLRRPLPLIVALAAALALAPSSPASVGSRTTVVDLARLGSRTFAPVGDVPRFSLAGVRWQGAGRVFLRTRDADGRWSSWRDAAPEEDGPDAGTPEGRRSAWRPGSPWWTGESNAIQARTVGEVTRVRATLVSSSPSRVPYRALSLADAPAIVPRAAWGANEAILRGSPVYSPDVRYAVVHHTAGRNDYSRADAPAIVKAIQLYHVQGNGWNDVGYNFLVDRFGTVYEGRGGGVDRNVVGAHAQGFNTGSVGIAFLGTYSDAAPPRVAQQAISRLIAWRLDIAHVDPTSFRTVISGGSDRFAAGVPVLLNNVSGHRDTGFTECPGGALYKRLGVIAADARSIGGQKIFDPVVETVESQIRVRARLARSGSWTVTVTDAAGLEIARGVGVGDTIDWTWESAGAVFGRYSWTIAAEDARPAVGTLRAGGGAAPLEVESAVEPAAISPNADGQDDSAVVTYRISSPANVTVRLVDELGVVVTTPVDRVWTRAGQHSTAVMADTAPDGRYSVMVTARSATGALVETMTPLSISRTLGLVTVTPTSFSPNGDGRKDQVAVAYSLTVAANVRIRIERDGRWVATLLAASLLPGPQRLLWDGSRPGGLVRDAAYSAIVEVDDGVTAISSAVPLISDTVAPRVRVLPGRGIRLDVSEPAILTLRVDGRALKHEVLRTGVVRVPWTGRADRIRVVARDAAGNAGAPVTWVRR